VSSPNSSLPANGDGVVNCQRNESKMAFLTI
jgi:hypothetical protein